MSIKLLIITLVLLSLQNGTSSNPGSLQERNKEYLKYMDKIVEAFGEAMKNTGIEPMPQMSDKSEDELKKANITDYLIKVQNWLERNPDVHTRFNEIKESETKHLRQLYAMLNKPELELDEKARERLIEKIASKEQYLVGSHISKFEMRDMLRMSQLIETHLDEEGAHRKRAIRLKALKDRINHISTALKESNISHKDYKEILNANASKQKPTHIPYPMSHRQMIEAWTHEDHMDENDFKIEVFFELHDLNEDGVLDPEEIDALLSSTLPKDLKDEKRETELINGREFLMKNVDENKDGLISLDEIKAYTASEKARENEKKDWQPEENLDEEMSQGSALEDYKRALESLEKEKPDPNDLELTAEWEAARRELDDLYKRLTIQGTGTPP